jgi:hypothetical protein
MAEQDMGVLVHRQGRLALTLQKNRQRRLEPNGFRRFFFAFLSVIILGAVHENSRTIAETEGHAKPAGA